MQALFRATTAGGLAMAAAVAGLTGLTGLASTAAQAQPAPYPSHPITLVVPFGAGGGADVYGREIATKLGAALGQPVVVENRTGAGSVIGTAYAAKAPPDGYTLVFISVSQTMNESLYKKRPYDLLRDFAPVAPLNESALVLVEKPALPYRTVAELVAAAKASPGKLNYASSGVGSPYHMAGELLKNVAGVDIVHVPYSSSGAARAGMLGGQAEIMYDLLAVEGEFIKSGALRPLAVTGAKRSILFPDVPTMAEAGYPHYQGGSWLGLLAPKGTPAPIVERLNQEINKISSDPDTVARWAKDGTTPVHMSPDAFGHFLVEDIAKWRKIVDANHIATN
ncbi:MAG: tripartite tricarboxylate transporter substrate binding protein [Pseudomonadota bacterium]